MTLVTCDYQPGPHTETVDCRNPQRVVPEGEMDLDEAIDYILRHDTAVALECNHLAAPAVYLARYVQQMRD